MSAESRVERVSTKLAQALRPGCALFVSQPPGASLALAALELAAEQRRTTILVTDGARTLDTLWRDLNALAALQPPPSQLCFFPAWESLPGHGAPPPADLIGDRLASLQRMAAGGPPLVVATCVQALLQRTPERASLAAVARVIRCGDTLDPDATMESLVAAGYEVQVEVQRKGQIALRGGIMDVWPVTAALPSRIELFGNEVDSLRSFDPADQRSIDKVDQVELGPAEEKPETLTGRFTDFVPADALWIWLDEEGIHHHAALFAELVAEARAEHLALPFDRVQQELQAREAGNQLFSGLTNPGDAETVKLEMESLPELPGGDARDLPPDMFEKQRAAMADLLRQRVAQGWQVHLFFGTEGSRNRFAETYGANTDFRLHSGSLSEGFVLPAGRLMVVGEADFFGRRKERGGRYGLHGDGGTQARAKARQAHERIHDWSDIQPGDFVVHLDHGIGKYLGLYEIEFGGRQQEVLTIEYAEGAKLYLPVGQTHLLSRYVGVGKARPELHTLGAARWGKEKRAAQQAVQDLAALLLETQAARHALEGHSFGKDTPWQHEFEESFPYQETPDQQRAIDDTKSDMEARRPMDRLVCGDVGYGKTEVAMRAAFKAVIDGKQVAMLVPTTILAQQHYDTFRARMAAFPVRIEMLSRFQSRAEQNDIVRRLKERAVDIVIGTHRLVQNDVGFADLGLVIIDEEQKFGVAHKEYFKRIRRLVDVLTLTATPIPRTLHMSLIGARDLSVIESPPVERLPIETIVAPHQDDIVREAILRELNREGQVYFLHNRVGSIETMRDRLAKLVPEARIEVGHGQMHEDQLAAIMRAFVRGDFDVLLCTTIIESGLDIPNVNTILIDRADRFGMAELYQLRGRVGRYKRKAYAYLLLPKHGQLFDTARKRIGAMKKYSQLGAGFRMAMRDLEIRGAGNILGAEQSGHIATVGFDLYCQLLKRTVSALKGEKLPPIVDAEIRLDFIDLSPAGALGENGAAIPVRFLEDETQRVSLYRRIAALATAQEIEQLRTEVRDRCGRLPASVERLFRVAELKILAAHRGVKRIETQGEKIMLWRRGDYLMPGGRYPRFKATKPDAKLAELATLLKGL